MIIRKLLSLLVPGAMLVNAACVYHDLEPIVECTSRKIEIVVVEKNDVTSCEISNGLVRAEANGSESFVYKINQGPFQEVGIFRGLNTGTHWIYAQSKEGCMDSLEVEIENLSSNLRVSVSDVRGDSECVDSNGSVKIGIENGTPPFQIYLNEELLPESPEFENLNNGFHNIQVVDADGCRYNLIVSVPRLYTGISWASEVKPIIDRSCAKSGCHGTNSSRARLTTYQEVKANAAIIKSKTQNGSMPYDTPLPQDQVDLIACWVDDGALEN